MEAVLLGLEDPDAMFHGVLQDMEDSVFQPADDEEEEIVPSSQPATPWSQRTRSATQPAPRRSNRLADQASEASVAPGGRGVGHGRGRARERVHERGRGHSRGQAPPAPAPGPAPVLPHAVPMTMAEAHANFVSQIGVRECAVCNEGVSMAQCQLMCSCPVVMPTCALSVL